MVTAPLAFLAGSAIAVIAATAVWVAVAPTAERSSEEIYALIAGALPSSWLLGFVISAVSGGSPVLNLAGQAVFGVVMFAGLRRLHVRIKSRTGAVVPHADAFVDRA